MHKITFLLLCFPLFTVAMQKENFNEQMILAIKLGDFETVQTLTKSELFNPSDTSFWKYSYLHIGCYPSVLYDNESLRFLSDIEFAQSLKNYENIIKFLIEKGVSYTAKNDDKETPLMRWIAESCLVNKNLKLYSSKENISNDCMQKIKKIYINSIRILAPYNTTEAFFYLCYSKHPKLVSLLIQSKAKIDERDRNGNTLLHRCVQNYNEIILAKFLKMLPTKNHKDTIATLLCIQKIKKIHFPKLICWKVIQSLLTPIQLQILQEQRSTKESMATLKNNRNKTALDQAYAQKKILIDPHSKACLSKKATKKLNLIISLLSH